MPYWWTDATGSGIINVMSGEEPETYEDNPDGSPWWVQKRWGDDRAAEGPGTRSAINTTDSRSVTNTH